MRRMSLLSLPVEVLDRICSYIQLDTTSQSWIERVYENKSLALANKFLSPIAQRHLYRQIDINNPYYLARTLHENPTLAQYCKSLYFTELHLPDNEKEYNFKEAHTFLCKPGVVPPACTRNLAPDDTESIHLMLWEVILFRLTALKSLYIELGDDETYCTKPYSKKLYRLFDVLKWKSFFRRSPLLPQLCNFSIVNRENTPFPGMDPFEQVYTILRCPSIRCLHIQVPRQLYVPRDFPQMNHLMKTSMLFNSVTNIDFERFTGRCPNLIHVAVAKEEGRIRYDTPQVATVDTLSMIRTLQPRCKMIRELQVHCAHSHEDDWSLQESDLISDLSSFTDLSNLSVDARSLLSFIHGVSHEDIVRKYPTTYFLHKLPPSLKTLRIYQGDSRIMTELMQIPLFKREKLPELSLLNLAYYESVAYGQEGEPEEPPSSFDREKWIPKLEQALAMVGVKLQMQ